MTDDDGKVEIELNFDELTLGDIEHLEQEFGMLAEDLMQPETRRALGTRFLTHFVWCLMRHKVDGFTLEDARAVKLVDLPDGDAEDEELDPTSADDVG